MIKMHNTSIIAVAELMRKSEVHSNKGPVCIKPESNSGWVILF